LTEQPLSTGRSLSVPRISRRLNGKVPVATEGVNRTITPAAETLLFAGQAPVLNYCPLASPTAVELTLAGHAPTSDATTYSLAEPAEASLSLTSYAPSVFDTRSIHPAAGSLALSTYNVTLRTERVRRAGARTRFISLTTRHGVKMLYR
jgi:hypothetical protein